VPLFRRRREPDGATGAGTESVPEDQSEPAVTTPEPQGPVVAGPVDADELDDQQRTDRLDLGALLVPTADGVLDGLEVQLQADEASGEVLAVLILDGTEAAVELRAFAAPKRTALWESIRAEIAEGATAAGGQTADTLGAWGIELLVQVPVALPDGQQAVQVSRIAGIDGARWFLRATFLGRAALEPETAGRLQHVVEGLAVLRGGEAMAPRDPLPLTIPGQQGGMDGMEGMDGTAAPEGDAAGERAPLQPFERGPEITEIR